MGKKLETKYITDDRQRLLTFRRRKSRLMKQADELSVLCNCEIALIVFSSNNKLYEYTSSYMDEILLKYTEFNQSSSSFTNKDIEAPIKKSDSQVQEVHQQVSTKSTHIKVSTSPLRSPAKIKTENLTHDSIHKKCKAKLDENEKVNAEKSSLFKCNQCHNFYKYMFTLRRHKKQTHENNQILFCYFCDRDFKSKPELQNHISIHTKENPYKCEICSISVRDISNLITHKKTHLPKSITNVGFAKCPEDEETNSSLTQPELQNLEVHKFSESDILEYKHPIRFPCSTPPPIKKPRIIEQTPQSELPISDHFDIPPTQLSNELARIAHKICLEPNLK